MREFRFLVGTQRGKPAEGRDKGNTVLLAMSESELAKKFCVWSMKNYHYYVFDKIGEYVAWFKTQPVGDRCFFEVVNGESEQRLKIDCDKVPDVAARHACMEAIKGAWLEKFPDVRPPPKMLLFSTGKSSYHIIIDHFVKNVDEAKDFFDAVQDRLSDEYKDCIDPRVYAKRQNFRLVGCTKEPGGIVKRLINGDGATTKLEDTTIGRYN